MNKIKTLLTFLSLVSFEALSAQTAEMADAFRAEGKIYVVIAVMSIILIGIGVYLFSLDRRISKMEKHNQDSND